MRDLYYIGKDHPEDGVRAVVELADGNYLYALSIPNNGYYITDAEGKWMLAEPSGIQSFWPRVKRVTMAPGEYVCLVVGSTPWGRNIRAVSAVGKNTYLVHSTIPMGVAYEVVEEKVYAHSS